MLFRSQEVADQVRRQQIAEEHNDVIGNQQYFRWAQGRMQQELAEGKPDTKSTIDSVMDMARRKFGLTPKGGRPAPTAADRRRMSGVSRGGGGSMAEGASNLVPMTKAQREMADAAYSHIKDEKTRHKMWASKAGKRLQESGKHE